MSEVTIFAPSPILTVTVEDQFAGDELGGMAEPESPE